MRRPRRHLFAHGVASWLGRRARADRDRQRRRASGARPRHGARPTPGCSNISATSPGLPGRHVGFRRHAPGGGDGRATLAFTPVADRVARPGRLRGGCLISSNKRTPRGVQIRGQVSPRAVGICYGLDLSFNPFIFRKSYREIEHLPPRTARRRAPRPGAQSKNSGGTVRTRQHALGVDAEPCR